MIQIQFMRTDADAHPMHKRTVSAMDEHQHQRKSTGFETFLEQQDFAFIDQIHTQHKNEIICSCL